MRRVLVFLIASLVLFWLAFSVLAGLWLLPPMLLHAPMPERMEKDRETLRTRLLSPGAHWKASVLKGGESRVLEVWRLHRAKSKGVVLYLHGFGDDAWGTLGRAAELPEWDAVGFTFRGRDRHPDVPCTLGGWERADVVAVVNALEKEGVPRAKIVIAAWSQGAGVALLALSDLEKFGTPLGGALLECPYEDIYEAAKNHIRLALGPLEVLARPAEWIALRRAGKIAAFDPRAVSPAKAADGLRTPIALVTGEADPETPVEPKLCSCK
ncbi:MAG: alpha/beta fold hydrolase [Holophaga sp.]|nr:alpha/beta fold hydrolase [Holophaga sp.]